MSTTTKQTNVLLWHYNCPQCGIGDGETGHHAQTHAIYCEICLEDGQQVKLRRWPVEDPSSSPAGEKPVRG